MDLKRTVLQTAAAAAAAALLLCGACHAAAPDDSAHSAVLVDAATGRVLYEKNADARSLIASTTKIMTALIICEQCDLQDIVTVPAEAVGVEGSSLALTAGEELTVEALLYGMMLRSGNDAAAALAIYSAGSIPAFAEKMNRRAAELGLRGTHFENPHGLDADTHYSTARDLARLACAALKNADLRRIVGTKTITVGGRALTNHNKLLWRYPGATGVKTGYTKKAGRVLVSSAQRDGWEVICVTIGDPDDWRDHAALLDFAFAAYAPCPLLRAGERLTRVPVFGGAQEYVWLCTASPVTLPLSAGERAQVRVFAPQYAFAPVLPGFAGHADVLVDGTVLRSVPLYFEAPVAQQTRRR